MRQWVVGAVMGLIGLFGLLLASRGHEGVLYVIGLLLFALAVVVSYWLIIRNTGQPTQRHDH